MWASWRKTLFREPSALAGRHKLDSGGFMSEERQRGRPLWNEEQVLSSVTDSIAWHLTQAFKANDTLVG